MNPKVVFIQDYWIATLGSLVIAGDAKGEIRVALANGNDVQGTTRADEERLTRNAGRCKPVGELVGKQIAEMREQGLSYHAIALSLGVSDVAVLKGLQRYMRAVALPSLTSH